jgi:N-acetylneuraminic acid mutarotase
VSGSNSVNAGGVSGIERTGAAANVPGARGTATAWSDGAGNLWLFGGVGFDSGAGSGVLNDLWRYSPASGLWTWMSGSNLANADGTYGAQGTAAAGNVPGARELAVSWTDSIGNLWLFGGNGRDGSGSAGQLNDLWQYSPGTNEWTWVSGSSTVYAVSVYGTQGTPAAGNVPGSLQYMVSWTDAVGDFWLFGGFGNAATTSGTLNVLWRY